MTHVIITTATGTETDNLHVGQSTTVNCMAVLNTDIGPDSSSLHKEWYHSNEIITTDAENRGDNLQLQLQKVKTSLAGYYECLAWIDDRTLRNVSDNILLYVNCEYYIIIIVNVLRWQDIINLLSFNVCRVHGSNVHP